MRALNNMLYVLVLKPVYSLYHTQTCAFLQPRGKVRVTVQMVPVIKVEQNANAASHVLEHIYSVVESALTLFGILWFCFISLSTLLFLLFRKHELTREGLCINSGLLNNTSIYTTLYIQVCTRTPCQTVYLIQK